jgi:hypothetical protein
MTYPFGIVGIISLTVQISRVVIQFGLNWKHAPDDIRSFLAEFQTLKTVLSETNMNFLLGLDFAEAFQSRASLVLSQLRCNASSATDAKVMLAACHYELESLLNNLNKREGHRARVQFKERLSLID